MTGQPLSNPEARPTVSNPDDIAPLPFKQPPPQPYPMEQPQPVTVISQHNIQGMCMPPQQLWGYQPQQGPQLPPPQVYQLAQHPPFQTMFNFQGHVPMQMVPPRRQPSQASIPVQTSPPTSSVHPGMPPFPPIPPALPMPMAPPHMTQPPPPLVPPDRQDSQPPARPTEPLKLPDRSEQPQPPPKPKGSVKTALAEIEQDKPK